MISYFLPRRYHEFSSHQHTLLDGELVLDTTSNGEKKFRFLVYDAVAINNKSIAELNLLDRLKKVYVEVLLPRLKYEEKCRSQQLTRDTDTFHIYMKVIPSCTETNFFCRISLKYGILRLFGNFQNVSLILVMELFLLLLLYHTHLVHALRF